MPAGGEASFLFGRDKVDNILLENSPIWYTISNIVFTGDVVEIDDIWQVKVNRSKA